MATVLPEFQSNKLQHMSILEVRLRAKSRKSLKSLKQSSRRKWDNISAEEARCAAENFAKHPKLRINAETTRNIAEHVTTKDLYYCYQLLPNLVFFVNRLIAKSPCQRLFRRTSN